MMPVWRIAGQVPLYLAFAAGIGHLSTTPAYSPIPPDTAMIVLSFTHVGQRVGECRQRSPEELAQLPPNMRRPLDCPRGRVPVVVELELDGKLLAQRTLQASGLSHDRASSMYQKHVVPAGRHRLVARLRDTARPEGFDYERIADVTLEPRKSLVLDFRTEEGGFIFR